jgi:iron(III) transport system ATP-binding protein
MFLEIENVFFAYPGKDAPWILEDYSLRLAESEIVGLAGPSGEGKSTLLRLIAGLEKPQKGSISIDGKIMAGGSLNVNPENRKVGLVFQDYGLFPHMTVTQNVAYGLFRLNKTQKKERIGYLLELTKLSDLASRYPYQLSGGQQQRAALARALAPGPKLLLLDEPLSNIDANLKAQIRRQMRELLIETKTTCLFVSHDLDDLKAVSSRLEVMGAYRQPDSL